MKKWYVLSAIALALASLLFITACPDESGDGGDNPPGGGGNGPGTNPDPGGGNGPGPGTNPGMVWTAVPKSQISNIADFSVRALAWGSGKFVAGGEYGRLAYSPDGKSWTNVTDSTFASEMVLGIAWGNGKFVAVGNSAKIAYSSDGIIWTAVADESNAFIGTYGGKSGVSAIVYGNDKFVAVGGGTGNGGSGRIAYSSDGIIWTAVSNSTFGTTGISRLAYGDGKFVAAASSDKMAVSSDGITWTAVTQSIFLYPSPSLNTIAYGSGKFIAVGYNGTIAYSTNGETWTVVSDNPFYYPYKMGDPGYDLWVQATSDLRAIVYGGGKFVAVDYGGKTAVSPDGVTWTIKADRVFAGNYTAGTQEAAVNNAIRVIAYDGGKFIVMPLDVFGVAYWDGN